MSSRKEEWGLLGTIAATLLAVVLMITVGGLESITNRDGGTIYNAYCVNCHGANG
ncbi:MAG TPA: cytochrome c, partial [Flavobacteriales bacterium]|nr:cytochrome c [Flavobacteriales bacterium]